MKQIRIEPEAEAELAEVANWYESRSKGLGDEFLRAFEALLGRLERNPEAYQKVYRSFRRATLRRFPYNVIYKVTKTEIAIVACIHGRRHPRQWKRRV